MAIVMLYFEQVSRKFCFNFLTPILSASSNMMRFVCTFSIMRAYGVRLILSKKFETMEKLYTSKTF